MSRSKTAVITTIPAPKIYVGPTLDKWPLKKYTSFIDGIMPSYLAQKLLDHPEIKPFFIDPAKISEIERKIADKTSYLSQTFDKIKELNKG